MRALFLSSLQPPRPGVDVHGIYKRLALHIRALRALGAAIEIVYYVTEHDVPPGSSLSEAAAQQAAIDSDYWGVPIGVHFIRRRIRSNSFKDYYLRGIARAAEQPAFAPWAGPEQAEEVGRIVDSGPDLVLTMDLHVTCALMRSGRRPRRLIVDLDDVQHLVRWRWCRQKPLTPGKLLMLSHIPALLAAERRAAREAEAMLVCSTLDRGHLARLGFQRLHILPNAVDIPPDPPGPGEAPTLLFVGGMGHWPNEEAAERMVKQIFPRVLAKHPDATLVIAGKGSDTLPSRAANPRNVEYLGFVRDLDPLIARTAVFVCPMLNGGGTRIKLLDAAAHALPIVSTRMGVEGLDLVDGRDALLRDGDDEFAAACLELLADPARRRRLGLAARAVIAAEYDAAAVQARLETLFAPHDAASRPASQEHESIVAAQQGRNQSWNTCSQSPSSAPCSTQRASMLRR